MKPWSDGCILELYSPAIRWLVPGVEAKLPEKRCTTFRDFMLRQIKRTALRDCCLHIGSLNGLVQEKTPHPSGRLTLRLLETQPTAQIWISECIYLRQTQPAQV